METNHRIIKLEREPVFVHISDLHIKSSLFQYGANYHSTKNLFKHFVKTYPSNDVIVIITGNVFNTPFVRFSYFTKAVKNGIEDAFEENNKLVIEGGIQMENFRIFSCGGNNDAYGFGIPSFHDNLDVENEEFNGWYKQDLIDPVWTELRFNNIGYHLISVDTTEEQKDPFTMSGKIGDRQMKKIEELIKEIRSKSKKDKIILYMHHCPFTEVIEEEMNFRHLLVDITEDIKQRNQPFDHYETNMLKLEDKEKLFDILRVQDPEDRIDLLLFGHIHSYWNLTDNKGYKNMIDVELVNEERNESLIKPICERICKFKVCGEGMTTKCFLDEEQNQEDLSMYVTSYSQYSIDEYGDFEYTHCTKVPVLSPAQHDSTCSIL